MVYDTEKEVLMDRKHLDTHEKDRASVSNEDSRLGRLTEIRHQR